MENNPNEFDNKPEKGGGFKKFMRSPWAFMIIVFLVIMLVTTLLTPSSANTQEISYSAFLDMVHKDLVKSVTIQGDTITIEPKASQDFNLPTVYTTHIVSNDTLASELYSAGIEFTEVDESSNVSIWMLILDYLPMALMSFIMIYMLVGIIRASRGSKKDGDGGGFGGFGGFGFAKSNAKQFDAKKCNVRFSDVAGQDEAKQALIEFVDILKNPTKYTSVGAEIPKGALLVGPPGTGKTLLAKAVAGEAGCPFFFVSGSAFVEMFVGTGAARVRDLFKHAAEKAPCIVFIDEIDAIGKKRDGTGIGGNDEREQTLNQLLAEMDGFDPDKGIMVLGATNRPEILDKALLRPGRFDRRIPVELPDMNGRVEILQVHARKKKMAPNVDLKRVADSTPGASGAELANILNEAALTAVRNSRDRITQGDLEHATEYVIAGSEKKSMVISPEEKRIIAYHEIGHALVAARQKNSAPVRKITIIPRTNGALGFTMQAEEKEHFLMSKEDLIKQIQVLTAGRAAEELIFGTCTSGASNDIERATAVARNMITRFGMNDDIGMMTLDTVVDPYLDGGLRSNASQETATKVEKAIRTIIDSAYDSACAMLKDNALVLNRLAQYLLEHENITGDEFMDLLREYDAEKSEQLAEMQLIDEQQL